MSDEKPDATADNSGEKTPEFILSKKDLKKLAEMTASLVGTQDDKPELTPAQIAAQRPGFTPAEESATDTKEQPVFSKKQKGLVPGGLRIPSAIAAGKAKALVYAEPEAAKLFSVNKFPRDFDAADFSVSRAAYAQALEKTSMGHDRAWSTFAPKEKAYFEAIQAYGKESKAAGEMVSGQDGGFLAPN